MSVAPPKHKNAFSRVNDDEASQEKPKSVTLSSSKSDGAESPASAASRGRSSPQGRPLDSRSRSGIGIGHKEKQYSEETQALIKQSRSLRQLEKKVALVGLPLPSRVASTTVNAAAMVFPESFGGDRGKGAAVSASWMNGDKGGDGVPGMLHDLAVNDRAEEVEALMGIGPKGDGSRYLAADIDAENLYGETALRLAADLGNSKAVWMLLDCKADVNLQKNNTGRTALHHACQNGHLECVKLLLEAKAPVNAVARYKEGGEKNKTGVWRGDMFTPLLCASSGRQTHVVRALSEGVPMGKGRVVRADVNVQDGAGKTALHLCASRDMAEAATCLLDCGANIEAADNIGETAVHAAVHDLASDMLSLLARRGADPNTKTDNGNYPMRFLAGKLLSARRHLAEQQALSQTIAAAARARARKGHTAADAFADMVLTEMADKGIAEKKGWGKVSHVIKRGELRRNQSSFRGDEDEEGWAEAQIEQIKLCMEILIGADAALMPTDRMYQQGGMPEELAPKNAANAEKHVNKSLGRGFITNQEADKQRKKNFARNLGQLTDAEVQSMREQSR